MEKPLHGSNATRRSARSRRAATARVVAAVVTVASSAGLLFFSVMALVDPAALVPGGDSPAAAEFAGYVAARSLPLGAVMLGLLILRKWRPLAWVLAFNGVIQLVDTMLGASRQDAAATIGPGVFTVALFACAAWVLHGAEAPPSANRRNESAGAARLS